MSFAHSTRTGSVSVSLSLRFPLPSPHHHSGPLVSSPLWSPTSLHRHLIIHSHSGPRSFRSLLSFFTSPFQSPGSVPYRLSCRCPIWPRRKERQTLRDGTADRVRRWSLTIYLDGVGPIGCGALVYRRLSLTQLHSSPDPNILPEPALCLIPIFTTSTSSS